MKAYYITTIFTGSFIFTGGILLVKLLYRYPVNTPCRAFRLDNIPCIVERGFLTEGVEQSGHKAICYYLPTCLMLETANCGEEPVLYPLLSACPFHQVLYPDYSSTMTGCRQ